VAAERWKQPEAILAELYDDAESRAIEACEWYLADRRGKKTASRLLRGLAVLLASAGGLIPLANVTTGQSVSGWGYLLLAGAGACFGFDRFLGLSAGWMRDMTTAQRIQRRLQVFQFDWTALDAARAADEAAATVEPYLTLLRDFVTDLSNLMIEETSDWVSEFQSGLQLLEAQTSRR
jgi:SMODS and SLOG-associating 2TM effector domain 2